MTQQHPITPPSELVQQWLAQHADYEKGFNELLIEAAQWGADQELLACGNYLKQCAAWEEEDVTEFYDYRRPKPPSLKEQALEAMRRNYNPDNSNDFAIIRRALEQLDD
jgi:hypothetical protein